jgi:hypothetical protein
VFSISFFIPLITTPATLIPIFITSESTLNLKGFCIDYNHFLPLFITDYYTPYLSESGDGSLTHCVQHKKPTDCLKTNRQYVPSPNEKQIKKLAGQQVPWNSKLIESMLQVGKAFYQAVLVERMIVPSQ